MKGSTLSLQKPSLLLPLLAGIAVFVFAAVKEQYLFVFIPFAAFIVWLLLRNMRTMYLLLLFCIPISTEIEFSSLLATDFPDELLMILLTSAIIAVFIYKPNSFPQVARKSSLFLLLLLQLSWIAVTAFFSYEPLLSFKHLLAKTWYVIPFVLGTIYLCNRTRYLILAAKIMLFGMLIPIAYSWYHHAQTGFRFETINPSLGPFFRNHVNYAALIVCLIPVALAFFFHSKGKAKKWWAVLTMLFFIALVLGYSRGAWICLFTGIITIWAVRKKYLLSLFAAGVMFILLSFGWLVHNNNYLRFAPDFNRTIYHSEFSEHMQATYALKDISTVERFYRWIAGMRMVATEPITGFGPASFYSHYRSYAIPVFETWVSNNPERSTAHNYFLLLAIEQGIPGLIIFLLLIVAMYATAIKVYHASRHTFHRSLAMIAAVIFSMILTLNMLSDLIETDKIGSIFYLLLGVLIYLGNQQKNYASANRQ